MFSEQPRRSVLRKGASAITALVLGGAATGTAAASDDRFSAEIDDNGDEEPKGEGRARLRYRSDENVYEFDLEADFQNVEDAFTVESEDVDTHVHAGGNEIALEEHGALELDRDVNEGDDDDVRIRVEGWFGGDMVNQQDLVGGTVDVHVADFDPDPAAEGEIETDD